MSDKDDEKGPETTNEKPWWSEAVRDLTSAGIATLFMTEDSIRGYLKEKKLPKELVSVFLEGLSKKKDDAYGVLSKEIAKMFSKIDVSREISRFLETHHVHLEAKISFKPKAKESAEGSGANLSIKKDEA